MKKISRMILGILSVLALLVSGCGSKEAAPSGEETNAEELAGTTEPAEGYEVLGGWWEVGGVYDTERRITIDISDSEGLSDLYDATFLSFSEDGTFMYIDLFAHQGSYEVYNGSDEGYAYYLLKTDVVLEYDSEKEEFVEKDPGSYSKTSYILTVLDENTLEFCEMDPLTGKAKADRSPLIFVKSDESSNYLAENKTEIVDHSGSTDSNGGTDSQASDNDSEETVTGDHSSYQAILDEYTRKMEDAVPGLVSEYKSEAAGTSDIERLAEICNDKVGELAEICTEGIGEMAELMYAKGDSYDTYESWAGELQDNYADIAEEIQDAYLDSVMN